MSILGRKLALIVLLAPLFALGQGSQLPKYTVATLPASSTQPHYIVQVIDGASSTDCATGGGAQNVACVNVAGVWHALGSVSPTFTGTVTVNSAPAYSVRIGPLGTMAASWNFDTTTAASACASIGCASGGLTSFAAPSGSWPTWLVPTVTNSTSTPSLAVAATSTGSGSVVLSASPTFTGTPTAPTAAATDNTTQLATDAFVHRAISSLANTPAWLTMLGDGSDGSCVVGTSCLGSSSSTLTMGGEYYFTNFSVPYGATVQVVMQAPTGSNQNSLVVHATGACTVAGEIDASWDLIPLIGSSTYGYGGGTGGVATGTGTITYIGNSSINALPAGKAYSGNGYSLTNTQIRGILGANPFNDGLFFRGSPGSPNGNIFVYGAPGLGITLICGSIIGTDGVNTGTLLANGGPAATYSAGSGYNQAGGGGGGVVILSSQATIGTLPVVSVAGGAGEIGTAVLAAPSQSAVTTITTGGSCAASTQYCYQVASLEGPSGISTPHSELCVTTGSTTSTNTNTVPWNAVYGATGYNIYGRTTGVEQLIGTVGVGTTTPSFVDTCTVTPSGALPTVNTTTNWYSVPQAVATAGSCTSPPKALLTATSGALTACTVIQQGAGCGTGSGIVWKIIDQTGGFNATGSITPTWSSGSMVSCTASGGSGYTNTEYGSSFSGGDGGAGWYAVFQGW